MTVEQYRCLVAHLNYWKHGIDKAMSDCGIPDAKADVIDDLWKAGHKCDEATGVLTYDDA